MESKFRVHLGFMWNKNIDFYLNLSFPKERGCSHAIWLQQNSTWNYLEPFGQLSDIAPSRMMWIWQSGLHPPKRSVASNTWFLGMKVIRQTLKSEKYLTRNKLWHWLHAHVNEKNKNIPKWTKILHHLSAHIIILIESLCTMNFIIHCSYLML